MSNFIKGGVNPCESPGETATTARRETGRVLTIEHLWLLFYWTIRSHPHSSDLSYKMQRAGAISALLQFFLKDIPSCY